MAANDRKKQSLSVIDPIYQKFMKSVVRSLGSTEFYEFFMDAISRADNQFQFSNRKMEKLVDIKWVDAIEEALEGMQNIIANPRNIIREDELIVNVAHVRKAGSDVVRHLAQHGSLVDKFDEDSGEVRPNKLMQKIREDSTELYENRVAFTVMEEAYHFVKVRYDALFESMGEEFGAKLKVDSNMESATEQMHVDMFLSIRKKDSALEVDEKNRDVFSRIDRMNRLLTSFMNSPFGQQMAKVNRVKGTLTKTNVLKKNPDYKKIVKLYEFLKMYNDVGYVIKITEQNPHIDEVMEQNIYHNILFQYIVLKGYLEDEADRALPAPLKQRKRKLKPKVIREIMEELTENYDLPDVEIRKVLIEELTKEQLMQEEAAERLRLVEEQEQRKRAEEERLLREKEAEEERLRKEREAEEERIRLEKEEEERIRRVREVEQEIEDRRRSKIFSDEWLYFQERVELHLAEREEERRILEEQAEEFDFAEAARLLEEAEERQREAEERVRRLAEEEAERARRLEEERLEEERRAKEAEAERIRIQQETEQKAADMQAVASYLEEVRYFQSMLYNRSRLRMDQQEEAERELEALERQRTVREAQVEIKQRKPERRRFIFK